MRPHATLPPPLRRKRKTESIASNMEPTKYRTRSMIIVYYDSAVQEAFEAVVRNVSTARNLLRKGRMAAKMKQVTALPDELASLLGSDESALVSSRLAFSRMSRARGGGGDEKTIFDTIDQALEASQSFCEHGAHQFLRDGDCAAEIASIKLKLGEVRTLAQAEWARLAKEEEATTAPPAHDLAPAKAAVVDAKLPSPLTIEVDPDY
ncbi:MAG: hypothetical protein M1826_005303 [Phylliscum demangeonii]|nr:MAG: hypothetical protein M1826_005303 [Phylliscum demangeonii]